MASSERKDSPALFRPSQAGGPEAAAPAKASASAPAAAADAPHSPGTDRDLPPVMKIAFQGGDTVELLKDQFYADRVVVRAGERGKAMQPSSQAASWVVLFPRKGPKTRVVPEWLLRKVEDEE